MLKKKPAPKMPAMPPFGGEPQPPALQPPAPKFAPKSNFDPLKGKLAKKPGVTDPGGLAAKIGIAKFGKAGMAAKAKAGKAKKK